MKKISGKIILSFLFDQNRSLSTNLSPKTLLFEKRIKPANFANLQFECQQARSHSCINKDLVLSNMYRPLNCQYLCSSLIFLFNLFYDRNFKILKHLKICFSNLFTSISFIVVNLLIGCHIVETSRRLRTTILWIN